MNEKQVGKFLRDVPEGIMTTDSSQSLTKDDGNCAIHALFGTINYSDVFDLTLQASPTFFV